MNLPLSILDLATIVEGTTASDTFRASVEVARYAEERGFLRYWFAEHHNLLTIASSSPAVLIAHIAAHTERIRVGAGGVMLPNHSPLVIAEQYGTLERLHPGRIDLGLGRAPGGDHPVFAALRRSPNAADRFPEDVLELQALFGPAQPGQKVEAVPATGTRVPLYILGSSLFGAQLAAALGLPYAFASHFAPGSLEEAVTLYRREFRPSEQLAAPYVITAMNVYAADSPDEAARLYRSHLRNMALHLITRTGEPPPVVNEEALFASPAGRHAQQMLHYSAIGTPGTIRAEVERFARHSQADEVIIVTNIADTTARLRSFEIVADEALSIPTPSRLRS
ncbi:MAG TPA: LLM class flavin-dependent oxidoreductase [Chthoniobacteraceae bacterium]|nr:LLM class flavin-dependent oxidoreductase [Chthoniobacteraceae bacterium]